MGRLWVRPKSAFCVPWRRLPTGPSAATPSSSVARGRGYEASARSVKVRVLRLRRAIEEDASGPQYIRTVWGLG